MSYIYMHVYIYEPPSKSIVDAWYEKKQLPAESNGSITLDNKWYGNCKKRGRCRLNFLHQFCPSRKGTQQYLLGLHQV